VRKPNLNVDIKEGKEEKKEEERRRRGMTGPIKLSPSRLDESGVWPDISPFGCRNATTRH